MDTQLAKEFSVQGAEHLFAGGFFKDQFHKAFDHFSLTAVDDVSDEFLDFVIIGLTKLIKFAEKNRIKNGIFHFF